MEIDEERELGVEETPEYHQWYQSDWKLKFTSPMGGKTGARSARGLLCS